MSFVAPPHRPLRQALHALGLLALLLLPLGCGRTPTDGKPEGAQPKPAARIDQAQLDRFRAEGPVANARRVAPIDYVLHYRLMQATGMVDALGGQPQALEALQALGNAYQRHAEALAAHPPRLQPVAFTGEGMSSGFVGFGMGVFGGSLVSSMSGYMVSEASDARVAELVKAGPIELSRNDRGGMGMTVTDTTVEQTIEYAMNEHGVSGALKVRTRMDTCPDREGRVSMTMDVDSKMAVTGKPGIGGAVTAHFILERWLDDDAHLIDAQDGSASHLDIRMSGSEHGAIQSADVSMGLGRDGQGTFTEHGEQGFSIFHPDEAESAYKLLQGAQLFMHLMSEAALRSAPWQSGRCVKLEVTSDPAKRTGARPNTAYTLRAMPRAKADGAPTRGTVTATLSGGSTLNPTGKVKADAQFDYANPDQRDQRASIAFEARSKRGVGKATLNFDTLQGGWRITLLPGCPAIQGDARVCDLTKPFAIRGTGGDCSRANVSMQFTPTDDRHGRYRWLTTIGSIKADYGGSYTIETDGDTAVIQTQGAGCATGPGGKACGGASPGIPMVREPQCADGPGG